MTARTGPLDPTIRSTHSEEFQAALRKKIVGQEEAVQSLVDLYQVFCAGLNSPGRPVGGDQGGLRGVPALARDRQADRFASGISGAPGDASADHPGSIGAVSHGEAEAEFFAVG